MSTVSNNSSKQVLVVGPIPPPLHGQSKNTHNLCLALEDRGMKPLVANTSSRVLERGLVYHANRAMGYVKALVLIVANSVKISKTAYFACDGGLGLIYLVPVGLIARIFKYRIFVHHRNFSYIDTKARLMSFFLKATGPEATHIFLCDSMRASFVAMYGQRFEAIIVSNATHIKLQPNERDRSDKDTSFVIGHLSNLSIDKGLLDFLGTLRACREAGLPVKGALAGPPMQLSDKLIIDDALQEFGDLLEYLGPVYGEEKNKFFKSLDLFLFPSRYKKEAQPNVLFEAISYSVPVIAFQIGCIACDLGHLENAVVDTSETFIDNAKMQIEDWIKSPESFCRARERAFATASQAKSNGDREYAHLIDGLLQ